AINYRFVDSRLDAQLRRMPEGRSPARLLNPSAAQMDRLRTTLWGGLVENLRASRNPKPGRLRLLEVRRVFLADPPLRAGPPQVHGIAQPRRIAMLAYGPAADEHWSSTPRRADFFDLKGDIEALAGAHRLRFEAADHPALHPGRSARIAINGRPLGWIGEM